MTKRLSGAAGMAAACALAVVVANAGMSGQAPSGQPPAPASAQPEPAVPPGDATRGEALVLSSGCVDCHRIGNRGSRVGPNLSDIGGRRTPYRLQQALVAPDDEVLVENRFARVVTKDGASVTGKLLNQDAISVQLLTDKEELKTYLRTNIREYTILDKGLMPSSQGKLTGQQVADIVAYLGGLKN